MALTQEQKELFIKKTGVTEIPNGELQTSGGKFDNLNEQILEAVSEGNLPAGTKLVGLVDRVIIEVSEEGVGHRDFLGVLSGTADDTLGLIDNNGVAWYTKEQKEGIKKLIALA